MIRRMTPPDVLRAGDRSGDRPRDHPPGAALVRGGMRPGAIHDSRGRPHGAILQPLPPDAQPRAFLSKICVRTHEGPAAGAFRQLAQPDRRAPGEFCHRVAADALADDRLGAVHQVSGNRSPGGRTRTSRWP